MSDPAGALRALARVLAEQDSVIAAHVRDPGDEQPALGLLAAAGPRATGAPGEYALVVESVREGYLLHYATGRLIVGADPDLALLAGDYLYALGLERLAGLDDLEAVRELSDLISLAAQVHDGERCEDRVRAEATALWLACAVAIGAGSSPAHERAKAELRAESESVAVALWEGCRQTATEGGLSDALARAADAIDFRPNTISLG